MKKESKEEIWIKVQNPKAGDEVKLVAYKKVLGADSYYRKEFVGMTATVEVTKPTEKDKMGCLTVLVWVGEMREAVYWRVASMRKLAARKRATKQIAK